MLIDVLIKICGVVLLLSTSFAFFLWYGHRHQLLKYLLFSWLSGIGSFAAQGIFNNTETSGLLAFSINWVTVVFFLKIYSKAAEINLPFKMYNVFVFLGLSAGVVILHFWDNFQVASAIFCFAVAGSVFHASLKKNLNDDIVTFGYRALLIGDALHFLDYPFVRPVPEYAIFGFSITLVFFFCFAVYVPTFILRKISIDYNKDLVNAVETRTRQLKESNNQLQMAFDNIKTKNEQIDSILKESQTRLSVLVHDLSTPLTLLFYNLKTMLNNPRSYLDHVNEKSDKILSATKTIEYILKDAKDTHTSKLGKKNIALEDVSLDVIVHQVLDLYDVKINEKKLSVEYDISHLKSFRVLANNIWLKDHVLANLISNAIKFSYSGGIIRINAMLTDDNSVILTVSDNGVGIPAEKRTHLFDLNVATSSIGTNGEAGTGLGLPIVKQYLELMGGKIKINDNNEQGTSFEIILNKAA